ncbi:aminotransferase-like domain-containing protein [Neoroseomonas soli]|uniref:PLP-dependent aminotransferase family protein n=1 Tax=Neoroseomonas soli TaxID=1081025 RepID=A0A9X9WW24_9PROT|nr:PLP-dependent aminotransferase family protein [Neoroseomonas soli]MBR0671353.1 PLP-dependent aminotransferase family protein [Neoroseomonas soli]
MVRFDLESQGDVPRQAALRRAIVAAIETARLAPGQALPSSRELAQSHGLARNTVVAVYEDLIARGLLHSVPRRGVFVAAGAASAPARDAPPPSPATPGWTERLQRRPSLQRNIVKPRDWQRYPYPFIYGQVDPGLFPLAAWRACSRDALGRNAVNWWVADHIAEDDPLLIEQLRRHVLPRRGILAREDEILTTLGSQEGFYLVAQLLFGPGTTVGVEDPGYPDARNIAVLHAGAVRHLPVDAEGLVPGPSLDGLDALILSPGHHCPTMAPLSPARRRTLLEWARQSGAVLIEDDYEGDLGDGGPALCAQDRAGCVLHLGSFSKVLAPGVRLGFLVGPAPFIAEARALRRLMHRNTPLVVQRTAALFLAEGHYDGLIAKLREAEHERRMALRNAVRQHLPAFGMAEHAEGSALWLRCPPGIGADALCAAAAGGGVLVEPGGVFFADPATAPDCIRLGISAIPAERIEPGIMRLAACARILADRHEAPAP